MAKPRIFFHFQLIYSTLGELSLTDVSQRAEDLGYDGISITDSPLNNAGFDPMIALAQAAAVTKNMFLSTGVLLLPLTNVFRLAREVATLDVLSGGRVILGLGMGGEKPEQYQAFGIPLSERGKRTNEYIEILKGLWTQPSFSYHGRYYSFDNLEMDPKPIQKPHPPIWVGGRMGGVEIGPDGIRKFKSKTAALKRAAFYGDGWLPNYMTPEMYSSSIDQIRGYAKEYGRDSSSMTMAHLFMFLLRDNHESALKEVGGKAFYGEVRGPEFSNKYDLVGAPQDFINRIQEFVDLGVTHFILHPICGPSELAYQMDTVAKEVLPAFR